MGYIIIALNLYIFARVFIDNIDPQKEIYRFMPISLMGICMFLKVHITDESLWAFGWLVNGLGWAAVYVYYKLIENKPPKEDPEELEKPEVDRREYID